MRHGETLGYYIPAQKRSRKAEVDAMRAAAKDPDEMIASWGVGEEELVSALLLDCQFRIHLAGKSTYRIVAGGLTDLTVRV
jgi:hypothetical protein